MRKTLMGATLALVLTASLAMAQRGGGPPGPGRGGPGGRGGPPPVDLILLNGITLSDAQKTQLDALHEQHRSAMDAQREAGRELFDQIRAARQSGDTATANRLMRQQRAKMDEQRDQEIAALRALLTADQQVQFDKNLAAFKER